MEYLVELFSGKESELYASLLKGAVVLECLLNGLSRVLITDVGVKSCNEHKGVVKVVVHLFSVRNDTYSTLVVEGNDGLRKKTSGLEEVINTNGHKYVKLEVTLGC